MTPISRRELASRLEPSLLRPDARLSDVEALCHLATSEGFAVVLVEPFYVPWARRFLLGTSVRVGTVAGYPFGANEETTKVQEAVRSLAQGASDIDLVMNIGAFKSGMHDVVRREVAALADLVHASPGRVLKVILETGYLTPEEIREASRLAVEAGADYVKTGTGYGPRGVSVEDIRLIREAIGNRAKVKAAGGIRTWDFAGKLLEAGADRIGTSQPLEVLAGAPSSG